MNQRRNFFNFSTTALSLLLATFILGTSYARSAEDSSSQSSRWQSQKTRVFIVSMTSFKGGVAAPWGTKDCKLINHWGDTADLKGVDNEDEFEAFNPIHSPFYGLNPINRIKPWNYVNKHIGMSETITADTIHLRYHLLQLRNDHPDGR